MNCARYIQAKDTNYIENIVRIVYHCPESKEDVDRRCWGKHRILYQKFQELGYNARYRVCEFKWDELKVPKEVLDKAPKSRDYHLYLEIKINNKWIRVDCSDDPRLKLVEWDGKTDTRISVKCLRVLSPKKSAKIEENERKNYDNILKEYHEFYL